MVLLHRSLRVALVLSALLLSFPGFAQSPSPGSRCEPWAARLISFQGTLSTRRAAGLQQASVNLNETFCIGDVLEVGPYSRAAVQLPDQTVVRLDQGTVVTFATPGDDKRTWLDILKGAVHIISRDPRALRVITPFANAGIEGTEFLVQVGPDAATVLVFEGRVKVENASGAATAGSGESVVAKLGSAPVLQQVVRPRDAVVWTLYYPPTSVGPLPAADAEPTAAQQTTDFYIARAEQRLAVGQVTGAEADLDHALKLAPGSGEVLARQSVIALTQNDTAAAERLATEAVAAAPESAAARLAQSYAMQASGNLPGAISALQAAAVAHPDNALVRARLAQLWFGTGAVDRSEQEARAAVAAGPKLGLARTILGFVELARVHLGEARADFEEAIRLQPDDPLPRLGLGLEKIRSGNLSAGREEIETAVIMDPNNSLTRSYVGKAYYEEKRNKLAASQLEIAKQLDPNDPTPWFYEAILKQSINEPVDALAELRESTQLNNQRAVYRSRLLLDDDAAARNASVSAVYGELGFEALAVLEGTQAIAESFGNSSAHRLLSNAYATLPRYDISRVSEALQAQIRQPLSIPPLNLLESADSLTILRDNGPSRVGINEYNSLFNRDQLRVQADAISGNRGTWGDQFVASGLVDRFGFALSQLHYETDGFSENNHGQKDIYGAFVQYEASPDTSLQLEGGHSEFKLGYTFSPFDEINIFPVEIHEMSDRVRFNGRHATSPGGDWIWTFAYEDRTRDVNYPPESILVTTTDAKTTVGELQRLDRFGDVQVISGAGYIDQDEHFPLEGADVSTDTYNAYSYGQWRILSAQVILIAGVSFDQFKKTFSASDDPLEKTRVDPKIGLVWTPRDGTTIRTAAYVSLRRPLIANQTLEPTEVAGFNQFFTGLEQFYGDPEGTVSYRVAGAVDQALSESLSLGIEGAYRRLEVPYEFVRSADWYEQSARAYVYKALSLGPGAGQLSGWETSLSLSGEYEKLSRPMDYTGSESIVDVKTTRVPFSIGAFAPSGLGLRLVTSYVHQNGDFSVGTGSPVSAQNDHAWITDALIQYRLPRRLGMLSFGVRNISDQELGLVDTDPLSPRVATRRLVTGAVSIVF